MGLTVHCSQHILIYLAISHPLYTRAIMDIPSEGSMVNTTELHRTVGTLAPDRRTLNRPSEQPVLC